MHKIIKDEFEKLYGLPCWNVQPGYGTFLTLEFGDPYLQIREPMVSKKTVTEKVKKHLEKRLVTVRGEWHLWLYYCEWFIFDKGKMVGECTDEEKANRGAKYLNGQILTNVSINKDECKTIFEFDLGGKIEAVPDELMDELWLLYTPSKNVLTLRADKKFSFHKSNAVPDKEEWKEI